ncbi:ABC transporter substrate-binding protein [Papillibacter cinnamivorans]|uniref:Putative ABC transport system substrate-binding protein n=1 Tax=Papillibacter cinnamivorans DSM 12816 TaxID=1122930 RepID=A0A1W1ZGQ5_9FIRM|nr:ABC transporter substrate-binding protein [Papillibacter cinnamivorans]SMC47543.1 putative ABC transport system substrate-binding protein [Papillibacter cinnamivorans DSM 12816]
MKLFGKKTLALALAALMALALAACSGGTQTASPTPTPTATEPAAEPLKIGVIQYAPHPSLDNCYTGFLEGLADAGYVDGDNITVDFQNAQGDMSTSDLIAKNMASSEYDLILGIATPAAMSAYSATKEQGIPVVFCAVSDPLAAGLVESLDAPNTNCTGTSDVLNLEAQMKMIRAFLPDAKTIGVLYTTSEPNSVSHLAKFKELAPTYGFTIVDVGITSASEVASGAATLVSKGVDCVNNFTDNNVVNNLATLLHETDTAGIPVFGSEVEQVKNGCIASESIDYVALGRQTGAMAAKILSGEATPETMPVLSVSDTAPVYNEAVCKTLGISLPADYADAESVSAD